MNVCNVLVSMPRAAKLTEGAVHSAFTAERPEVRQLIRR